jgi:hypothetical protein
MDRGHFQTGTISKGHFYEGRLPRGTFHQGHFLKDIAAVIHSEKKM